MPSLCQADWETSSQQENDCEMVEEKEASDMGDGGDEEKAEEDSEDLFEDLEMPVSAMHMALTSSSPPPPGHCVSVVMHLYVYSEHVRLGMCASSPPSSSSS